MLKEEIEVRGDSCCVCHERDDHYEEQYFFRRFPSGEDCLPLRDRA
jgi:hypothetical protein